MAHRGMVVGVKQARHGMGICYLSPTSTVLHFPAVHDTTVIKLCLSWSEDLEKRGERKKGEERRGEKRRCTGLLQATPT